uniref:Uncharacterized protein n=1 Tax=Zooxanthella nutricula TaxID=1333877 RepID=A0A6U9IJT4_9DINO
MESSGASTAAVDHRAEVRSRSALADTVGTFGLFFFFASTFAAVLFASARYVLGVDDLPDMVSAMPRALPLCPSGTGYGSCQMQQDLRSALSFFFGALLTFFAHSGSSCNSSTSRSHAGRSTFVTSLYLLVF